MRKAFSTVMVLLAAVSIFASGVVCSQAKAATYPVTAQCVLQAARLQNIPFQIILGFLKTEGGRLGMESRNSNGSYDLGPMQINSTVWVPKLAVMHFGGDEKAAWVALRDYGCYNINIGAWIFRQYLDEAHGDYADAVGLYNSHNPAPKRAYQIRFAQNFEELFGLGH
jgi:soluble lytic murein transglycosylase-like protein